MFDTTAIEKMHHAHAIDDAGEKVGKVGQVYADNETNEPTFVTVKTGLFGLSESFVPLEGARLEGDDLHLAYSKEQIKDAPRIDEDGELTPQEEDRLYDHYDVGAARDSAPSGGELRDDQTNDRDRQPDVAGTGDDVETVVVVSEEDVVTDGDEATPRQARLRRYTTDGDVGRG